VLELACGPGVNLPLLERAIGPSGSLTALDYSEEMTNGPPAANPAGPGASRTLLTTALQEVLGHDRKCLN
jgi:hypothetical protein